MKIAQVVEPPNALILIMDFEHGVIPESIGSSIVASTKSCVAVGTKPAIDGQTRITLTDEEKTESEDLHLLFEDEIEVPGKKIAVCSVMNEKFMEIEVPDELAKVSVWVDDLEEPGELLIIASEASMPAITPSTW